MGSNNSGANYWLGLLGAAAGGAIGYFGFWLLYSQGLYAMVLPGAMVGLGCGAASGGKSNVLGAVCAALAVAVSLSAEWTHRPFLADDGLAFFLTHLHQLKGVTMLAITIGAGIAYWLGRGRPGAGGLLNPRG